MKVEIIRATHDGRHFYKPGERAEIRDEVANRLIQIGAVKEVKAKVKKDDAGGEA